jgi:hypothetical protein
MLIINSSAVICHFLCVTCKQVCLPKLKKPTTDRWVGSQTPSKHFCSPPMTRPLYSRLPGTAYPRLAYLCNWGLLLVLPGLLREIMDNLSLASLTLNSPCSMENKTVLTGPQFCNMNLVVICLHCPLRGNGSINTFPRQQIRTHQPTAILEAEFSMQSLPKFYAENLWASLSIPVWRRVRITSA